MGSLANQTIAVAAGGRCTGTAGTNTVGHTNVVCPGGGLAGFGGLTGVALVGLFSFTSHTTGSVYSTPLQHAVGSTSLPLPLNNLAVPVSNVGNGSFITAMGGGILVSLSGAGWTTGTITIIDPLDLTTEMAQGSQMQTPSGFTVQLVTPTQVFNNATDEFANTLTRLSVTITTPEPAVTLLFFGALSTLALLYGLRRRK